MAASSREERAVWRSGPTSQRKPARWISRGGFEVNWVKSPPSINWVKGGIERCPCRQERAKATRSRGSGNRIKAAWARAIVLLRPGHGPGPPKARASRSRALFGLLPVEALLDMGGAIARQHPGGIGAVRAFLNLELFGAPLDRGLAILRRDLVGIDQLLSKARGKWNHRNDGDQNKLPDHVRFQGITRVNSDPLSQ